MEVRSPALSLGRAPKSSALSCRPAEELRRAHQPDNASCRPHLRGSTCSASGDRPRSEELDLPLPARFGAPKSSSPSWHEPALAPPWKRLTTPGPRASSEELSLKLPAGQSAPKGTEVDRRETAPRLLRNRCRPSSTAPYPEGHDTAPGSTTWSLLGPFPKLFDPVTIRRPPRRLETRGRSEDHLATSRACVRAPGPRRIYHPRPGAPKDDETKEASASRPCGPSCSKACPKPDDPEGSPDELAPRISALELINTDHSPRSVPPKRLDAPSETSSELHGNALAPTDTAGQLRRASRQRGLSLPRTRCSPLIYRTRPPDPEGTGAGPSDHAGRVEDALPNERAASRLRRARRQGAERSERSRLSPFPTPGRSLEPEGSGSRQGCRVQTRGVLL